MANKSKDGWHRLSQRERAGVEAGDLEGGSEDAPPLEVEAAGGGGGRPHPWVQVIRIYSHLFAPYRVESPEKASLLQE